MAITLTDGGCPQRNRARAVLPLTFRLLCDGLDVKEPGTALIGRERECGQIERLIRDVRNGEGGCLVLSGEPGIGKTALLEHAAQVAGAATPC